MSRCRLNAELYGDRALRLEPAREAIMRNAFGDRAQRATAPLRALPPLGTVQFVLAAIALSAPRTTRYSRFREAGMKPSAGSLARLLFYTLAINSVPFS